MKRIVIVLLILASLSSVAFAKGIDGHTWNAGNNIIKLGWIKGYSEGFECGYVALLGQSEMTEEVFKNELQRLPSVKSIYIPTTLSGDELTKAIDHFYEEPENLNIPVSFALRVIAMKIKGATQEELDKKLSGYRKEFAGKE